MNFRMILRCPVGDPVGINVINFHQLPTSGSFFSLSFFEVWGDSNLGLLDSPSFGKDTKNINPSIIEWDLTNGPLRKLLELLDTQVEGSVLWVLLEISWNQRTSEFPEN